MMERLAEMIVAYRNEHRMGVRQLATEIGVSAATLNRVERGEQCNGKTLVAILIWLLLPEGPCTR